MIERNVHVPSSGSRGGRERRGEGGKVGGRKKVITLTFVVLQ